jgi:Transcriptional regulator, AbiEi antitoxin
MNHITQLIISHKTVFTTAQIETLLNIPTKRGVERFLRRAKKDGRLLNPQKGVWTLPVYDMHELAGALFPGGYISLEPVLFQAGVSFQYYGNTVQCVWHKNADIYFNGQNYVAKVIKSDIYNNSLCIQNFDGYRKAMPERALCDLVYLRPRAQFDNPQYFQSQQSDIRLETLLPLYPKTTQTHVRRLIAQQI